MLACRSLSGSALVLYLYLCIQILVLYAIRLVVASILALSRYDTSVRVGGCQRNLLGTRL